MHEAIFRIVDGGLVADVTADRRPVHVETDERSVEIVDDGVVVVERGTSHSHWLGRGRKRIFGRLVGGWTERA